jgi:hypothetical protein
MQDQSYLRESVVTGPQSEPGAGRYCAYNQTRECFLCADVESGDFSSSSLDTRLRSLSPGFGGALWMVPFRGISPTSVRIPIDLVYLDQNLVVLEAIESFPLSSAPSSGTPAASVLALPANTISAAGTRPGDRLILCAPEEMKRRLQELMSAKVENEAKRAANSDAASPNRSAVGRVIQFVDRSRPRPSGERAPVEVAPNAPPSLPEQEPAAAAEPAPTPILEETGRKTLKVSKSWLQRLLSPDPPEPRKATREVVQGLAAFYFTGGDPSPHAVRDVSPTGFYLFTDERWYPGTVIRMTLTDKRQAADERSITVSASVVRWGNDGVGLGFVLPDKKDPRGMSASNPAFGGANREQIEQFLQRFTGGAS